MATITCPDNGACSFWCTDGGSGSSNCAYMNVHAENSNTLTVACRNTLNTCQSMDIWCPDQDIPGTCVINGSPDTASVRNANIRSKYGFNTFQVNNADNQQSIGTMRCLDGYTSSCTIDKSTQNQCQSPTTTCDITTTTNPTIYPSSSPTADPTTNPTIDPTENPTTIPTKTPTKDPTIYPTITPTIYPSSSPTADPTTNPTIDPTENPTTIPTKTPTKDPTIYPTITPTTIPTTDPTFVPTAVPTNHP
eukprot:308037_1